MSPEVSQAPTADIAGMLKKRGNCWPYRWVDRRVVLHKGALSYFSSSSHIPRGVVYPFGAVADATDSLLFRVEGVSPLGRAVAYRFRASSDTERTAWINAVTGTLLRFATTDS